MSFLGPVGGLVGGAISSFFSLGTNRSIGAITGYITISENSVDTLEITQHPIQQGATITDHSFKKPSSYSCTMQFSQSLFSLFGGDTLEDIYGNLLTLQESRIPFTITTPTRIYKNMLFQSLTKTTDKKTENVLAISGVFQEIKIVQVTSAVVPKLQLKLPAVTDGIKKVGKKASFLFTEGTGVSNFFSGR